MKKTLKEHKEREDRHFTWCKKIIKELREIIEIDFGDECLSFAEGCAVCDAYRALYTLERLYEDVKVPIIGEIKDKKIKLYEKKRI